MKADRDCPFRQFAKSRGGRVWIVCYVVIVITGYITPDKHFHQILSDSSYLLLIVQDAHKLVMYDRLLSMD